MKFILTILILAITTFAQPDSTVDSTWNRTHFTYGETCVCDSIHTNYYYSNTSGIVQSEIAYVNGTETFHVYYQYANLNQDKSHPTRVAIYYRNEIHTVLFYGNGGFTDVIGVKYK